MVVSEIDAVVDSYLQQSAQLVSILQDIQGKAGYLSEEALKRVAERLQISPARVYSVACFYSAFSLVPTGKHIINVCEGTACHLRGAPKLLHTLKQKFDLEDGATSEDQRFTLRIVNCLGACALAPVVVINGTYYDGVTPEKLVETLNSLE